MSNARFSIIQAKAVRDKRVTDSLLRTLCALGLYSDKDGWCFPKQGTLGEDVDKNQQNISKDIQALVKLGYVESYPQWDKVTGARMQNKYRLLFDTPTRQSDDTPTRPRRVDNAPLNVPINTASKEFEANMSIENQIFAGKPITKIPKADQAAMIDAANIIATGIGVDYHVAYGIAYAFMSTRGIVIPHSKIKGQRKAVREMVEMGVLPNHAKEATEQLMNDPKKLTITDLYSISKTAIGLANPPKTTANKMFST